MNLAQALRLPPLPRLAVIGSGGKTTALFQLARSYAGPVWITTSTHLGKDQVARADRLVTLFDNASTDILESARSTGLTAILGPDRDELRVMGLSEERLLELRGLADRWQIPLLVEADGARGLPLKAPADHEPAIPRWVEKVVVVAGLSGIGRPLGPDWVHRPERFADLSGIQPGDPVTVEGLVHVLAHPQGGLKNIPHGASPSLVLNQADTEEKIVQAREMARALIPEYRDVVVAALRKNPELDWTDPGAAAIDSVHTQIAGVILAAGESKRLGRAKQTLEWRGEPLVRHVANIALRAGLSPVVVVTGAGRDSVENAVTGLGVTCASNPGWASGQSGSLQAGLRALPEETRAAMFLLCDQPQIPVELVRGLVERHARTLAPSVAPWVGERRGNPVLFDRVTFPDLLALEGDTGGRAIFAKYPQEKLAWADESILLDIDTMEDYRRLLEL